MEALQTGYGSYITSLAVRGINKGHSRGTSGKIRKSVTSPTGAVANLQVAVRNLARQTDGEMEGTDGMAPRGAVRQARGSGEYLRRARRSTSRATLRTRSWEDNGITRYVTEILVKTTGTMQMLGSAPQQNAQVQPQPQQNGQPQSADATKKGARKRKAVD